MPPDVYLNEKQKYYKVGAISKSNIKIVERVKIDTPTTQIHDRSFSSLAQRVCQCYSKCAPLLSDLFLHLYEADYIQASRENGKKLVQSFNFKFRHIDYILSQNNSMFGDFVDRIYMQSSLKKKFHRHSYVRFA